MNTNVLSKSLHTYSYVIGGRWCQCNASRNPQFGCSEEETLLSAKQLSVIQHSVKTAWL